MKEYYEKRRSKKNMRDISSTSPYVIDDERLKDIDRFVEENRDAILALCQSAKLLLEQDHEDAAKMVESVITLLEGNSADSSVLTTLLSAAADKI